MLSPTTIVVPCYNEAERLNVFTFRRYVRDEQDVRFLFVDDGSRDATPQRLQTLHDADPIRFNFIRLPHNQGKAEAVRLGMLLVLGQLPSVLPSVTECSLSADLSVTPSAFVGYWDADLATPLDAIAVFREVLCRRARVEAVIGCRMKMAGRHIRRLPIRGALGKTFARVASRVLNIPLRDVKCGAKLFRCHDQTAKLFAQPFGSRWIFDVELLARFASLADNSSRITDLIYEVPLDEWHDVVGSKLRYRDVMNAAPELASIWWRYQRPGAAQYDPPVEPTAAVPESTTKRARILA